MKKVLFGGVGALLIAVSACGESQTQQPVSETSDVQADAPALLPFELFFTSESFTAPRISPDGKRVAYLAPVDGTPNYFVAPVDDLGAARQLTNFSGRGVRATDVSGNVMYRWSLDGRFLIFPQDYDGDEHWDLWVADTIAGDARNLTPDPERSIRLLQLHDGDPSKIAISDSPPGVPQPAVYSLDLETGERDLIVESRPGILAYFLDRQLRPVVAVGFRNDGGVDFYAETEDGSWAPLESVSAEDTAAVWATAYTDSFMIDDSGRFLYRFDSEARDTNALVRMDLTNGAKSEIAIDPRVDIGDVLYHPETGEPLAIAATWDRVKWTALEQSYAADFEFLASVNPAADIYMENVSRDGSVWVVRLMETNRPNTYYVYDRGTRELKKLFVGTPQLAGLDFEPMHPFTIRSDDGLEYVSYYMLPPGSDPDGDGQPDAPAPMVMLVHGGPSDERAIYAFGPFLHWLGNRGYGSLYVNFRGSAGFGKAFVNAKFGEWGGKMHQDLLDQVAWAVARGIADPDRIAIAGGSYGGYATLVGMTMTPDVFACGVDIVGPSNLSIPMPHWDPELMEESMGGDPRTEEGRQFLLSISPVTFAHQTKNPVLIGQGDQDSRVPTSQSDEVVEKMHAAGAPVTYIRFPDEGHGFQRQENVNAFWGVTEVFLAECLGGRAEAIGDKLEGSSLIVPVGAEHIPGLPEALAKVAE
ncbi:MAG: S9 family peptidase [Sphingomonadales bacterium]|nr:S9 family peptidase [Sphingomonadales bacterium]